MAKNKILFNPPGVPFTEQQINLLRFMNEVPGSGDQYCDSLMKMYVYSSREKSESYERQKR